MRKGKEGNRSVANIGLHVANRLVVLENRRLDEFGDAKPRELLCFLGGFEEAGAEKADLLDEQLVGPLFLL